MTAKTRKMAAIAALASSALAFSITAHAEYVQAQTPMYAGVPIQQLVQADPAASINTTQLVWGSSLSVHALAATGAGQLTVRLTDIEWPEALESLDLLVTDLDGLWRKLEGPGSLLVHLSGPADLFLAVFAKSESRFSPGLYNLRADFAPVPLPAAGWLLLSALGGLAFFRRKTVTA